MDIRSEGTGSELDPEAQAQERCRLCLSRLTEWVPKVLQAPITGQAARMVRFKKRDWNAFFDSRQVRSAGFRK